MRAVGTTAFSNFSCDFANAILCSTTDKIYTRYMHYQVFFMSKMRLWPNPTPPRAALGLWSQFSALWALVRPFQLQFLATPAGNAALPTRVKSFADAHNITGLS